MRVTERQFSDLLRHPRDVAGDLEDGDVLLRRRDEPDLRLSRADREEARSAAYGALAALLRNMALHHPKSVRDALGDVFAWVELLRPADRRVFADEFVRIVAASAEIDNFAPVDQLIREWKATAEVYADPSLARRLLRPISAGGEPVPVPRG